MIRLTEDAQADPASLAAWIRQDSGSARAANVTHRILAGLRHLEHFPLTGRPGRVDGTRELVASRLSYISIYEVQGPDVVILRVLHAAQQWPPPGQA